MIQIFVIFSFLMWTIALLGLGTPLWIFLEKIFQDTEIPNELCILLRGTLGLILISVLGTIFNFFIPLDAVFSIIIQLTGIVLFFIYRKNIFIAPKRFDLWMLGAVFLAGSLFPLLNLRNYDTGLYHLPMINWITHSALPLGLANLHVRFGFNSAWFIDAAVVQPLRFVTKSPFFIVDAILFSFYGTFIFLTPLNLLRDGTARFSSFFALSTFIPWLYCLARFISSPTPDNPTLLMTLMVTFLLIKAFETMKIDYIFLAFLISFYAFTIKLSAIPYFFATTLLIIIIFISQIFNNYYTNKYVKKINISRYVTICAIVFMMGIPHLARGIVSSGYAAFPATIGFPNLQWSVPLKAVVQVQNVIKAWARKPGPHWQEALKGWGWITSWVDHLTRIMALWLGVVVVGLTLIGICFIKNNKKDLGGFLIVLFLSLAGCMFWFFTAPSPRFGYGYLYSFAGILLSYGLYNLFRDKNSCQIFSKIILVIFVLLCIFQYKPNLRQISNTKKVKDVALVPHENNEGVTIFTPKKGDQCFDAPLLCTPYFNKNLHIIFQDGKVKMFSVK